MSGGSSSSSCLRSVINIVSAILAIIIVIPLLLAGIAFWGPLFMRDEACKRVSKVFCRGIFAVQKMQIKGDELSIGVSDGNSAFDLGFSNQDLKYSNYKQQASQDYNKGNVDEAIQEWQKAVDIVTDDAESMIYIENARVLASNKRYVTIIVATTLSATMSDQGTSIGVAQDDLRGVYAAQKEFNQHHSNLQVRIALANLGIKASEYLAQTETPVLEQIKRLADTDNTVIGVVGFPFSDSAQTAISSLRDTHIPIVSPSASSNALSNLSPYFFRIAPPDNEQGIAGARFAAQVLHVQNVAVFSDSSNSYSKSLAKSFTDSFLSINQKNQVTPEAFTSGSPDTLDKSLNDVQNSRNVDMLFIAGYADDLNSVKEKRSQNNSTIPVMGGDAFYEFGGYSKGNYSNIYFTSFTYPDVWSILCPSPTKCASLMPSVADPKWYSSLFDPNHLHPGGYGYARPGPHVLLSYDAASALLQAATNVLSRTNSLSLDDVRDALQDVSFQGATGQIAFNGSDPKSKSVLMLCIDSSHHTKMIGAYGQFAPGTINYSPDSYEITGDLCA